MTCVNGKSHILPGLLILLTMMASPGLSAEAPKAGDEAITAAGNSAAAETEPSAEVKMREGNRQLAGGDFEAALLSFDEALRLNPRSAAARTGKGMALARQGKLEEAERFLREGLPLNPDPSRAHYELGVIYQKKGDYQRAATEFKQGIEKYRESHP